MSDTTTPLLRPDTREELQNAIAKAIHDQCCAKDLDHRDGIDHTSDWQIAAIAAECVVESRKPQWHKFDKDDENTWPEHGADVYVSDGKVVAFLTWDDSFSDRPITHWQSITAPSPPKVNE